MTIAERLRQEGHQIGWQEGMHEQAIKIALRMLESLNVRLCWRQPNSLMLIFRTVIKRRD